nr:MAG TPA: hypothetical protein [Caudoviricetes sp.]DAN56204.1 MAG TPA: hypothetical protein [Caudoviricetes sp.]
MTRLPFNCLATNLGLDVSISCANFNLSYQIKIVHNYK